MIQFVAAEEDGRLSFLSSSEIARLQGDLVAGQSPADVHQPLAVGALPD